MSRFRSVTSSLLRVQCESPLIVFTESSCFSVPTFTVIPDSLRSVSPLNVESEDDEDNEDDEDEDSDDVRSEGVPIEQYRAWLGDSTVRNGKSTHFYYAASVNVFLLVLPDEDSNLDPSPVPDMVTDSLLVGPMDEEERWLDALEKGELDENGELKKEIDETLLTARQVSDKTHTINDHTTCSEQKLHTWRQCCEDAQTLP